MRLKTGLSLAVLLLLFAAENSQARPEYAVKQITSCTVCHVNPWGGGPRTVYGKYYGSRDFPPAATSSTDVFYGDLRAVAFYPTVKTTQRMSGIALMLAAASADIPVVTNEQGSEIRLVATYNMAILQNGVREAYLRWKPHADENGLISYVTFGRFNAPFGLLTDEHRTYTRLQTNMTLNSYEMGAAVSGALPLELRYDLTLVNDFQTGGGFTSANLTYGQIANLRWTPGTLPLILGASENIEVNRKQSDPYAFSIYTVLSADRLTDNHVRGSISGEVVQAKNWNDSTMNPTLTPFFIPATSKNFQDAVQWSKSRGYLGKLKWDATTRFTLIYKLDYLALDSGYTADAYVRHGAGFEDALASNLILEMRYEKSFVGRPEVQGTGVLAAQDDIWAMLRLWL